MEEVPTPPQSPPPAPGPPEVAEATTLAGWVWIVLFGSVMALATASNGLLAAAVLLKRKKRNVVYALLLLLFVVNLADYGLLVFDFSLGLEHTYPHGQTACKVYQTVAKVNPVLQASIVVVLVYHAASTYAGRGCGSQPQGRSMVSILLGLAALYAGLAVAPAELASLVVEKDKVYCEIEISGGRQTDISIFYLIYSALMPYWLPLLVCVIPMLRLSRVRHGEKFPEVGVVLATVSSFFVFNSMHGCVVLIRHSMDAVGISLDQHHSWMIKVAQSLLMLVAYFWHVVRPILAIMMDADLKVLGCCAPAYDLVEGEAREKKNNSQPLKVLLPDNGESGTSSEAERLQPSRDPSHSTV